MFENSISIDDKQSQNHFETIQQIDANAHLSPYDVEMKAQSSRH